MMNDTPLTLIRQRGSGLIWLLLAVALLAVAGTVLWRMRGEEAEVDPSTIHTVAKEPIRISVVESGQLKAADSVDIFSEIRGSATILKLVEEGHSVKKGDILVELDASSLEDELTQQTIKYEQAKAAHVQAVNSYDIQVSTNESAVRRSNLDLELARDELRKWKEGGRKLEENKLEEDLQLALSEQARAFDEKENTRELVERNFAAATELRGDEIDYERAQLKVTQLQREQSLKNMFDWIMQERVLVSDVEEAEAELLRTEKEAEADLAKVEADRNSKKATLDLEERELNLIKTQLEKSTILSPTDGLVVYPSNSGGRRGMGSDRDRIEEGATVRERQLIVSLPDTSRMIAAVQVHESSIDKVKAGQPAYVTLDANSGESFLGKVSFVAPLPDSQSSWLNPDLKVYRVEITLSGDTTHLRPGMSVSCEIVIDDLPDALAVPVHAVRRHGSHLYCFLDGDGAPSIREVEVGLSNDSHVAVTKGLELGDRVFLAVPPNAPTPQWDENETGPGSKMSIDELRKATEGIEVAGRPEGDEGRRGGDGRGGRGDGRGGRGDGRGGRGEGGRGEGGSSSGGFPGGFDPSQLDDETRKRIEAFQNMSEEEKAEAMKKYREQFSGGGDGGGS